MRVVVKGGQKCCACDGQRFCAMSRQNGMPVDVTFRATFFFFNIAEWKWIEFNWNDEVYDHALDYGACGLSDSGDYLNETSCGCDERSA